jgi:uncharacterized protein
MTARKSFRPLFALVAGALLLGASGMAAAEDSAKQKDIRRLLLLTGSDKLGEQVVDQMIAQFKNMAGSKIPAALWVKVREEVKVEELMNLIIPIYDKHLSHPDIKAIIKFYQSPAGKKFIAALPQITQESMSAGQEWGKQVAARIAARVQKEMPPPKKDGKPGPATKKK